MELIEVGSAPWGLGELGIVCKDSVPSAKLLVKMLLKDRITSEAILKFISSDLLTFGSKV